MAFNADIYAIIGIVPANLVNLSTEGNEEITIKEGQSLKLNFSTGTGFAKDLPAEAFAWRLLPEDEEFIALNNGYIYAKKATNKNIIVGAYGAGGKIKLYYNINVIKNDDPSTQQCVVDEIMTTVNKANDAVANGATKEQLQASEDELNNVKLNYQNQGNNEEETPDVTYSGAYEYVDLGLPSGNKWATKNIGAAAPEDAGYYFAWGEECTKVSYTPESSYTYQVNSDALIATGIAKEKDGRMQFTSTYDAAAQIWRGNWVAPTLSDMEELTTKCDWYWETLNGERGYRVVGPNGNSIFLPTGGRKNLSAVVQTDDGCYWLNDAPLDQPTTASALYFNDAQTLLNPQARFHGFNMRAIIKGKEDVDPAPTDGPHEYVDLGLSVMWATCNVGASTPEDYGDYYAWGETETKDVYDWKTYLDSRTRDGGNYTKYYRGDGGKSKLDREDDVACVKWKGNWRMPTKAEQDELRTKCTWKWNRTKKGYDVTGPNGNSIFLPAAGYRDDDLLECAGSEGFYWSSELGPSSYSFEAYGLNFSWDYMDYVNWDTYGRCGGMSVRPVYDANVQPFLTLTVYDYNVEVNGGEVPIKYESNVSCTCRATEDWITFSSSNPTVMIVAPNPTSIPRTNKVVIENEQYGLKETITIVQAEAGTPSTVDLGLSVKWASCNVGASSPEDYGDYYAWGEKETKDVYNWSTYLDSPNHDAYSFTKYDYKKLKLDPQDDVAQVKWKGNWRIPTSAEYEELRIRCTWEWNSTKNGYDVIGPNGNSIFLPAAGYRFGSSLKSAGSLGYYWTCDLNENFSDEARDFYFSQSYFSRNSLQRYYGITVRPVWPVCP